MVFVCLFRPVFEEMDHPRSKSIDIIHGIVCPAQLRSQGPRRGLGGGAARRSIVQEKDRTVSVLLWFFFFLFFSLIYPDRVLGRGAFISLVMEYLCNWLYFFFSPFSFFLSLVSIPRE